MQITGRRAVFRTSQLEEVVGEGRNPTANRTMGEIIAARFSRRSFLGGSMAATAIGATVSPLALLAAAEARAQGTPGFAFDFPEVEAGVDADHHVAEGYDADILLRWGDPLFPDSPEFDPLNQTPEAQARQFGYNNDYVGYIPIDGSSEHGLLVVNHEYTNAHLMFPGIVSVAGERRGGRGHGRARRPEAGRHRDGRARRHHRRDREGRRRLAAWCATAGRTAASPPTTEMAITGPAAGHPRLQTVGRRHRHAGPRHRQQLRRRRHALGHLHHGRGELPRLLHRRAARRPSPRRRTTSGSACRTRPTSGAPSTTASTSRRSRTSRTASAGSSRSTSRTRPRCRRSAPRSAASSTRAPRASSTATAAWSSTSATTSASTTSTSS